MLSIGPRSSPPTSPASFCQENLQRLLRLRVRLGKDTNAPLLEDRLVDRAPAWSIQPLHRHPTTIPLGDTDLPSLFGGLLISPGESRSASSAGLPFWVGVSSSPTMAMRDYQWSKERFSAADRWTGGNRRLPGVLRGRAKPIFLREPCSDRFREAMGRRLTRRTKSGAGGKACVPGSLDS
jgi:hypothetical protein